MKRTAIYMRVSTAAQAQEGDSIPAQRQALRQYIDEHDDMVFVGEYLDDGISGTKMDRDELQRMLGDVENGLIDTILVTKMDRLHRSLRNFLNMQEILDRHNCTWLAIWEPMYDTSTAQGRMIINTMMSLGQFEVENTAQRIRSVFEYKAMQGEVLSGHQPFGYSIVDKHLVPNEDAEKVRRIFSYFDTTGSLRRTANFATSIGVPRTDGHIKSMLKNEKYIGRYRGNDNYCPAIIDPGLFNEVQRKIPINVKKNTDRVYIFSGLMVCPICGGKMAGHMVYQYKIIDGKRKMVGKEKGYMCTRAGRPPKPCATVQYLERKVEETMVSHIKEYFVEYEARQKPAEDHSARRRAIQNRLNRLKDLYLNELLTLDEYKADRAALEAQLAEIPTDAPKTDLSRAKMILSGNLREIYADLNETEKRYLWRSVVREIRPYRPFKGSRSTLCQVDFL